jgi:hypothetical protein
MRLDEALKNGHGHAINRSGRRLLDVIAGYADWPHRPKRRVLVREVLDENSPQADPRPLHQARTEDDAENYLVQQQYHVNPDEWYPG